MEELHSKESAMNELYRALKSKEKELQKSAARCSELANRVPSLSQDVRRLKMRCDRAGGARSRAIEKAIDRVRKHYESVRTKRVKHPNGRIEDWVRNLEFNGGRLVASDPIDPITREEDLFTCGELTMNALVYCKSR